VEFRTISRRSVFVLVAVLLLGLAGTVAAAAALHRGAGHLAEQVLGQQTRAVARTVAGEMQRYSDHLSALAAAVGAQAELEAAEFAAITAPVDRSALPGVSGIAFAVPATDVQTPRVQRYWRARGATTLTLRPAPEAGTGHLFIVLSRSADGRRRISGLDLSAIPEVADVTRIAQETRQVATSRTFQLRKDTGRPASQQQPGMVLAAAVRATSPPAEVGRLRGWMLFSLRGEDFLREAIAAEAGRTVAVDLVTATPSGSEVIARWQPDARPDPGRAGRETTVMVPLRTWQLAVRPTVDLLPHRGVPAHVAATLLGAVITLLLVALTAAVVTSRDRAVRRVRAATAALRSDIRRREEVEARLRQRETELKGFAGIVAHDLRSPLARISGYADFLHAEAAGGMDAEHRHFLDRVRAGTQQMSTLVDDLLGYAVADNQELDKRRIELTPLVEEVVRERTGAAGRAATIVVDPLPVIEGDPTMLRQVFDNLIGNAIKYTDRDTDPYVHISSRPDHGGWLIEIDDNGIGIPDDQKDAVFTAFTRAEGSERYPGTGLGLAIVHRIVERHGGDIRVEDRTGGGSRFSLTLARTAGPAGSD
jgi:signal transduction histidine kinase